MPPTRRCPLPSLFALAATLLAAAPPAAAVVANPGADAAAAAVPATAPSADVARLFKFHAAAEAEALREAVERAALSETLRHQLRVLLREHSRRVDEQLATVAAPAMASTPLDDLLDRAADLARDFNDRQIAAWLDEHPAAYQPVQEQIALAEAYERATAHEPDAVVRAARDAGLPPDKESAFRRFVTAAHERLVRAHEADASRLREAEEKAAAATPPGPRPPPGTGDAAGNSSAPVRPPVPPDAPRVAPPPPDVSGPDRPRVPASSPEARRLQLLDALTFVDAQTRAATAGREVRTDAEKILPQPPQRKVMDDEMLRWYQAHVPPEEGPRDGQPDATSPAARQRPGAIRKRPPSNDPGF